MSLTAHPEGSVKELWKISYPMMIASLSVMFMLVVDRTLLARLSQSAFNASVEASTLGWSVLFGWMILGNIAEVFVAQFNGAGKFDRISSPVWQMIWLGLFSTLFFLPVVLFATEAIYPHSYQGYQRDYFGWMILFGPSYPIYGALAGFFVGRGQVTIITTLSVVTNLVNAFLDYLLIFGVEGWIPRLEVAGAAMATAGSMVFQVLVLFWFFLNETNNKKYKTRTPIWDWPLAKDCLRVGFPTAIFVTFEMVGWALFYLFMKWASPAHITIAGICQSFVIMFLFFGEGLNKGVTAVVGNFIGGKKLHVVSETVRSAVRLNLLFFSCLTVVIYFFADELASLFLNIPEEEMSPSFIYSLQISIYLAIGFLLFEAFRMISMGVLMAAGDTMFLLIAGASSVWIFLVVPVYLGVLYFDISIINAQLITVLYSFMGTILYWWRYRSGIWKEIKLTA